MNGGFRRFDRPPGVTGSPLQTQATPSKPNRLSRSFRRSQQARTAELDSPRSHQPDFKTPTRIPRSRSGGVFSGESPHNDSDFQQDIIWDATSPSPNRRGKRGKKQRPGVVDISEIVSRIAPKHGRPEVTEPTLQQWIGDSATIPCTPDVQGPKPKKKSPRPNGVDDLLKLAKQFDFNMFHQDEEDVEELHQQSLELLPEDILDLEHDSSLSLPGNCERAVKSAGTNVQVQPDQHMEDDLDFLFDGPTQHVSGNLSQATSQVKPASSSHGSTHTNTKAAQANDFEDDWENDDLLDDSLVLEMTQNPQMFAAPTHSSTQKPSSEGKPQREGPVNAPVRGLGQSAKAEKDDVRQRTTFKLESNPNFSVRRLQTNSWSKSKVDYSSETAQKDSQQSKGASVSAGSQRSWQTPSTAKSEPQKPQVHPRPSVSGSGTKHNTSGVKTAQRPAAVSSHSEQPAASDLLDDDLLAFFSADPVWDDPADDDLLCEMCEDVENQLQNVPAKQTLPVVHVWNQRAALQPANQQHFPQKPAASALTWAPGGASGSSLAAGVVSDFTTSAQTKDSFRVPQTKTGSGCVPGSSRVQSAPPGHAHKDRFTFKKPNNPVQTATSKVVGKCSAAEIELKKQQAMERRRHRLQAQNLRAPT